MSTAALRPLVLPRGLIFLASMWLIGSWIITIGVQTPIQPVSATYTPGVRLMLMSIAVGLMIGWPLLRLSQRPTANPLAQTVLDLVVLLCLLQVVLWPMRLVTPWTVGRVAAIDAVLCAWLLLAAAVVATATGSERGGVRNLAMLACLGMCLLGPALTAVGAMTGLALDLVSLSPLMAVRALGQAGGLPPSAVQWQWIALLGTAAVLTWATLLALALAGRLRHGGAAAQIQQ
jgi:hypothetical protein